MKTSLVGKLLIASILFLAACKTSSIQNINKRDAFLLITIKSEPGVIQGLLESCSCLEIVSMDVVQVEPVLFDFTGNAAFPVTTVRLLIKIKQGSNSDYVLGQLLRMKEVVSINSK